MKLTNLLNVVAACVAGFVGGTLASQARVEAVSPDVVRASRFELLGPTGKPVARWELDPGNKDAHLCFLAGGGSIGFDIGLWSDGRPFLAMCGRDGKKRLVMQLDEADKPLLGMGDERWEGRILLGHKGSDTPDIPGDPRDQWALEFRGFGSEMPVALMGTAKSGGSQARSILLLDGKSIR
jgi:hypothetical protein